MRKGVDHVYISGDTFLAILGWVETGLGTRAGLEIWVGVQTVGVGLALGVQFFAIGVEPRFRSPKYFLLIEKII